jgi:hypothetical protein
MVLSAKKNGSYTFCSDNGQNIFTFGESHRSSTESLGSCGLQMRELCVFNLPDTAKVALSLRTTLDLKFSSSVTNPRKSTQKVELAPLSLSLRTWSNCSLYDFIRKHFSWTRHTVAGGTCGCWLAWQMDFHGLYKKASLTCSTFLPLFCDQPGPSFLQKQSCSVCFWYHSLIKFLKGESFPNLDWYHLCTIVTDFTAPYQKQHSACSWRAAILFNSKMQCQSVAKRKTTALLGNLKLPIMHNLWFIITTSKVVLEL